MTYKITKTDGTLLTEIIDGAVDQSATDLTLVGKNVSGYGEFINENFVKLLENFASTSQPNNPIVGQIWYDAGQNRLRVYDGSTFRTGSGPLVQGTPPNSLVQGDLWIDSKENQLYFYDGTDLQLAGPNYKASQGISGFQTLTIYDTDSIERVIVKLWVGNTLLGIFSKEPIEFTPLETIPGFAGFLTDLGTYDGKIYPGFNSGTLTNQTFRVNASSATSLLDPFGVRKTTSSFVSTEPAEEGGNTSMAATLSILDDIPLILGPASDFQINVDNTAVQLLSNQNGQDYIIKTKVASGRKTAMVIKGVANRVGIFNDDPQVMLHVGTQTEPSNVIIEGNLTVNGTTTTINTTELSVDDINITLADTDTPSDSYANGGGITIKGNSDKLFTWNSSKTAAPYNINQSAFNSSENINVPSTASYFIGGVRLFTNATTLATTITSAPGLTNIGTLDVLQVDNVNIQNNRLSISNVNGNLELAANGLGNISLIQNKQVTTTITQPTVGLKTITVTATTGLLPGLLIIASGIPPNTYIDNSYIAGSPTVPITNPTTLVLNSTVADFYYVPKITGLSQPQNETDAANKFYIDNLVTSRAVGLSLDITGLSDNQIAQVLNEIAPVSQFALDTIARVHCTKQRVNYPNVTVIIDTNTLSVDKNGIPNSANVLQGVSFNNKDLGAGTITVERSIKIFKVSIGTWIYDSAATTIAMTNSQVKGIFGP